VLLTTTTNVNKNLAGSGVIFYVLAHIVVKWVMGYHTLQEIKHFFFKNNASSDWP
jgi:hypothetical protein